MRRLTILVLAVAALYSGYWVIGSRAVENGAQEAIAQMQGEGWDIRHSGLNTAGFPNRFDTTVTDLAITTPDGAVHWSTAFLQVFALSYQPNKVIAVLPDAQQLRLPGQTLDITSTALRASAAVKPSTTLALRDITATSGPLRLTSSQGWQLGAASLIAALRDANTDIAQYDTYLEITGLAPPFDAGQLTAGSLPTEIARLRLDTRLTLSKPLDRLAGEDAPARLTAAQLRDVAIDWGTVRLGLGGDVTFNDMGEPTGTVTLSVTNWPLLITAATNAGLVTEQQAGTYSLMARNAAAGSDDLSVPITLSDGQASMGFIPLGYVSLTPP